MSALASEDDDWLNRTRCGDFAAIPLELTWLQSARLAHLLNGYEISRALGLGDLAVWANARTEEAVQAGSWSGTAIELWLCLFYEHRRWRHFGCEPENGHRELIDGLWRQLRYQLQAISDAERATIFARIAACTPKMR